jgi:hypothetical protein
MESRSHVREENSWRNCRVGDSTKESVVVQVFQDDGTRCPRCPGFPVWQSVLSRTDCLYIWETTLDTSLLDKLKTQNTWQ